MLYLYIGKLSSDRANSHLKMVGPGFWRMALEQEAGRKREICVMSAKKSAKEVLAVVSAMGALLDIIVMLVAHLRELGADVGECIYRLARPEGKDTLKAVAELLATDWRQAKAMVTTSLLELIALGNYNLANPDINPEHFPFDKSVNPYEETRIFYFNNHQMSRKGVAIEMGKEGWKPATIWHLLILGIKNPELQKHFPIIALGSVWCELVPCLFHENGKRILILYRRIGGGCDENCRFLAVRK